MGEKRKRVQMTLTVSVPFWMTAAQARREVRTLINEQCNFMDMGPGWQEVHDKTVRAVKLSPLPAARDAASREVGG